MVECVIQTGYMLWLSVCGAVCTAHMFVQRGMCHIRATDALAGEMWLSLHASLALPPLGSMLLTNNWFVWNVGWAIVK